MKQNFFYTKLIIVVIAISLIAIRFSSILTANILSGLKLSQVESPDLSKSFPSVDTSHWITYSHSNLPLIFQMPKSMEITNFPEDDTNKLPLNGVALTSTTDQDKLSISIQIIDMNLADIPIDYCTLIYQSECAEQTIGSITFKTHTETTESGAYVINLFGPFRSQTIAIVGESTQSSPSSIDIINAIISSIRPI